MLKMHNSMVVLSHDYNQAQLQSSKPLSTAGYDTSLTTTTPTTQLSPTAGWQPKFYFRYIWYMRQKQDANNFSQVKDQILILHRQLP